MECFLSHRRCTENSDINSSAYVQIYAPNTKYKLLKRLLLSIIKFIMLVLYWIYPSKCSQILQMLLINQSLRHKLGIWEYVTSSNTKEIISPFMTLCYDYWSWLFRGFSYISLNINSTHELMLFLLIKYC